MNTDKTKPAQPACNPFCFAHPLVSAAGVRERLLHYALKPNKALGQNFLIDEPARDRMLQGIDGMPVYEIGPGLGALTEGLLREGRRVAAVEKDAAMAHILQETLCNGALHVIHADVLELPPHTPYVLLGGGPFYVAGNLPYYITTPLVLQLLTSGLPIQGMTLMVQQEAAQRFFAQPGDRVYGPLRVLTAAAFTVSPVLTLSPSSFYPQPAVHSAIVRLTGDATRIPTGFAAFLHDVFAMRRKTLCNNLLQCGYTKDVVLDCLSDLHLPADVRASAMEPAALQALFTRLGTTAG